MLVEAPFLLFMLNEALLHTAVMVQVCGEGSTVLVGEELFMLFVINGALFHTAAMVQV